MNNKFICSRCNVEHSRFRDRKKTKPASYCKQCHADKAKESRIPHRLMPVDAKKRATARSYARVYLRRGYINREPCAVCGSESAEMHHQDYSKPLEIHWLCRDCHLSIHAGDESVAHQSPCKLHDEGRAKGLVEAGKKGGLRGGQRGGTTRMASLTAQQRSVLARKAAYKRWHPSESEPNDR